MEDARSDVALSSTTPADGPRLELDSSDADTAESIPQPAAGNAEQLRSRAAFDVLSGPYTPEYLAGLSYEELNACRLQIRERQLDARDRFEEKITPLDPFLSADDYQRGGHLFDDEFHVPVIVDGDVRFYFVDPIEGMELYDLRERARMIQMAPSFVEHLDRKRVRTLDRVQGRLSVAVTDTSISADNSVFAAYANVDGRRTQIILQQNPTGY